MGNAIVQATQQTAAKTCIDTYTNFKQLALSKDGASHCLYFLNAVYSDPAFTSAEDEADPMVIVKLDISNAFARGRCALDWCWMCFLTRCLGIMPVESKLMKSSKQPCMNSGHTLVSLSCHSHVKPFCATTLMMGLQIT